MFVLNSGTYNSSNIFVLFECIFMSDIFLLIQTFNKKGNKISLYLKSEWKKGYAIYIIAFMNTKS